MGADRALRKHVGGSVDMAWELKARSMIKSSNVLKKLISHANGDCPLEPSQVTAGIALMRKVLPDLTSSEVTGEVVHRFAMVPQVMPKEQWLATRGDPSKLIEHQPIEPEKPKDPNSKLN